MKHHHDWDCEENPHGPGTCVQCGNPPGVGHQNSRCPFGMRPNGDMIYFGSAMSPLPHGKAWKFVEPRKLSHWEEIALGCKKQRIRLFPDLS